MVLETDSIFRVSPDTTTTFMAYGSCDTLSVTLSVPENLTDISLCEGDSLNISLKYLETEKTWSADSIITIYDPGNYTFKRAVPGCIQRESIEIRYLPNPKLDLGQDSLIYKVDTIKFDVAEPGATFLWWDRTTKPQYIVTRPGFYEVEGWLNGCYNKNAINIELKTFDVELLMPNVFTPNGDKKNELFVPITAKGIVSIHLSIFNRYGLELFSSNTFDHAWDGTYNHEPALSGVYFYQIHYRDRNGNSSSVKGHFSLLR